MVSAVALVVLEWSVMLLVLVLLQVVEYGYVLVLVRRRLEAELGADEVLD